MASGKYTADCVAKRRKKPSAENDSPDDTIWKIACSPESSEAIVCVCVQDQTFCCCCLSLRACANLSGAQFGMKASSRRADTYPLDEKNGRHNEKGIQHVVRLADGSSFTVKLSETLKPECHTQAVAIVN